MKIFPPALRFPLFSTALDWIIVFFFSSASRRACVCIPGERNPKVVCCHKWGCVWMFIPEECDLCASRPLPLVSQMKERPLFPIQWKYLGARGTKKDHLSCAPSQPAKFLPFVSDGDSFIAPAFRCIFVFRVGFCWCSTLPNASDDSWLLKAWFIISPKKVWDTGVKFYVIFFCFSHLIKFVIKYAMQFGFKVFWTWLKMCLFCGEYFG
jgi:hypothetical protein